MSRASIALILGAVLITVVSCEGSLNSASSADASAGGDSSVPAQETCNGFDDDLDGEVDEGCSCSAGATQPCFPGAKTKVQGICKQGTQTCVGQGEFGSWGACQGAVTKQAEVCGDSVDQDCDGADEPCEGAQETDCNNQQDDDGDGLIDCGDPDCPPCSSDKESNCGDGIDNDGDGMVDCDDSDCPACNLGEVCDGKDNNGDGRVDEGNVCAGVGEPCPPGAYQACDCYCGVHRKCKGDGTWGPCKVDGNNTCQVAQITSHNQCPNGGYCDYGQCGGMALYWNECRDHQDCPAGKVCDMGHCMTDHYSPCP